MFSRDEGVDEIGRSHGDEDEGGAGAFGENAIAVVMFIEQVGGAVGGDLIDDKGADQGSRCDGIGKKGKGGSSGQCARESRDDAGEDFVSKLMICRLLSLFLQMGRSNGPAFQSVKGERCLGDFGKGKPGRSGHHARSPRLFHFLGHEEAFVQFLLDVADVFGVCRGLCGGVIFAVGDCPSDFGFVFLDFLSGCLNQIFAVIFKVSGGLNQLLLRILDSSSDLFFCVSKVWIR